MKITHIEWLPVSSLNGISNDNQYPTLLWEDSLEKFKRMDSVVNFLHSGRPGTNEEVHEMVLVKVYASPKKSIWKTNLKLKVLESTIHDILKEEKFHSFKLQLLHHISENNPAWRMEMVLGPWTGWMRRHSSYPECRFLTRPIFMNGEINKQSTLLVSGESIGMILADSKSITVWHGIWKNCIIGPYFFWRISCHSSRLCSLCAQQLAIPPIDLCGT